ACKASSAVQNAAIVEGQDVSCIQTKLHAIFWIAQRTPKLLVGLIEDFDVLFRQVETVPDPVVEAHAGEGAVTMQLYDRNAAANINFLILKAEVDRTARKNVKGIRHLPPQIVRYLESVNERRIASLGFIDDAEKELDVRGSPVVGQVNMRLLRQAGIGGIIGIGLRLYIEYPPEMGLVNWRYAIDEAFQFASLGRGTANQGSSFPQQAVSPSGQHFLVLTNLLVLEGG